MVVKRRRFNPGKATDGVSFRKRTYVIDLLRPAYREKNRYCYMMDVDTGQKFVGTTPMPISAKLLDAILRQEIAKQLVAGLGGVKGNWTLAIIIGLICAVSGILGGIIIGQFISFGGSSDPVTDGTAMIGSVKGMFGW